jgi:hypothetical protein
MSSEDIRYARRSEVGAPASVALIGGLATVGWIELMVILAQSKPW